MDDSPDYPAPDNLGPAGLEFWAGITEAFDLEPQDLSILAEACRVKDRLSALAAVIDAEGVTDRGPQGIRAHPALVESRQQAIALTRLQASLRLPDAETGRPQRRGGARGVYARGINGR